MRTDIKNIQVENIEHWDAPDYVDAFISYAETPDGEPLSDEELDRINNDSCFVHTCVMDALQ